MHHLPYVGGHMENFYSSLYLKVVSSRTRLPRLQLYVNFMQNADSYSFFLKYKIKLGITKYL